MTHRANLQKQQNRPEAALSCAGRSLVLLASQLVLEVVNIHAPFAEAFVAGQVAVP
jgi:hypothetical protein